MPILSKTDKKIDQDIANTINQIVTPTQTQSQAGKWYIPYQVGNGTLGSASNLSKDTLRAVCFTITRKVRLSDLALYLVSGGVLLVTKFRMGIYDSDPDTMLPRNRIYQSPEATVMVVNALYQNTGLTLELAPGTYWFAVQTDALISLVFRGLPAAMHQILSGYLAASSTTPVSRVEKTVTYSTGGLPAVFPTSSATQANGAGFNPEAFFIRTTLL